MVNKQIHTVLYLRFMPQLQGYCATVTRAQCIHAWTPQREPRPQSCFTNWCVSRRSGQLSSKPCGGHRACTWQGMIWCSRARGSQHPRSQCVRKTKGHSYVYGGVRFPSEVMDWSMG